jgi:hypothetical protein
LSFPETYEDAPWGHPVFKVGDNKMFINVGRDVSVTLTVKLTPEEREIALHFRMSASRGTSAGTAG